MSDNLDEDLDFEGASFDEFGKKDRTLAEIWRESPLLKVGAIAGGALIVLVIVFLLGRTEEKPEISSVPSGSTVNAPPGTEEVSPVYMRAIEEESERRVEEAYNEGGSALPTPIEPPVGRLSVPDEETQQEDPLQRWRRLQEERLQRELAQAKIVDARGGEGDGASAANSQAIQALSESLSGQMQIVLQTKTEPRALSSMEVTSPMILQSLFEEEAAAAQGGGSVAGATNAAASPEAQEIVLLPAGQIAYAQLITEANSDVPGPVLAQIVSGPLAGSRALGSFEVQKELLTLTFDKVIIKGVPYPANAIALDPGTTLPGMATEVDHRYFERVLLPMAASFVEGAARAVSESGLTSVTVEGSTAIQDTRETDTKQEVASGIEEAGEKLGEILDEQADAIEILVKIHAGTPVGLLFLDSVTKPAAQPQAAPVEDGQNSAVENLRRRLYGSR